MEAWKAVSKDACSADLLEQDALDELAWKRVVAMAGH
jgi:hypothetical protein